MAVTNELQPEPSDGKPPSQEGKKLVRANYGDRAAASIQEGRYYGPSMMRRVLGEFNPDIITHRDRRRMRQDAMVKMGLWYSKAPLIRADRTYKCEDPAIAAAVEEIVKATWISDMKIALNKYDFGFQGAVKQYALGKLDGTYVNPETGQKEPLWDDEDADPVVFGSLIPLPPETTRVHLEKGKFAGIQTPLAILEKGDTGTESDPVPPEWCLWFVNEFEEEMRNWYGRARIDAAYQAWHAYWFIFHMRNRHAEMDADPSLQIWYPPGNQTVDGTQRSNREVALEIGAKLRGGATIAWPSDVHIADDGKLSTTRLWEAAFLTGGENLNAFTEVLADLEIQKLRSCLVPEQALVEARRGTSSRNASASFIDIMIQALEQDAIQLDDYWNKYRIPAIVEANWGKDAPSCTQQTTGFQEEDLTLLTTLVEAGFQADPNALPVDWDEILRKTNVPTIDKDEQERQQQEQQAAQQGPPQPPGVVGPDGNVVPLPQGPPPDPQQLAASQRRSKPRKYEREVIHLGHGHGHKKVKSTAPLESHAEHWRREHNIKSVSERLEALALSLYEEAFRAAAESLRSDDLGLALGDMIESLVDRIRGAVRRVLHGREPDIQAEHASMYHAAGLAELSRLGLSAESWDVGRDEVQEWARWRAGELVKTIDSTIVENHIRPWLASALQPESAGPADYERGIPVDADMLASQLTSKFSAYPEWMAKRLVRTEARMGYNLSAADMWERVGVTEVQLYDGLGGESGMTDEECLARNGQVVTLDEFRQLDREEHPNGTLGAFPVATLAELRPLNPGLTTIHAAQSRSLYAVTPEGLILDQAATGRLLANG